MPDPPPRRRRPTRPSRPRSLASIIVIAIVVVLSLLTSLTRPDTPSKSGAGKELRAYATQVEPAYEEFRRTSMFAVSQRLGPEGEAKELERVAKRIHEMDPEEAELRRAHRHFTSAIELRLEAIESADSDDPELDRSLYERSDESMDDWGDAVRERARELEVDVREYSFY